MNGQRDQGDQREIAPTSCHAEPPCNRRAKQAESTTPPVYLASFGPAGARDAATVSEMAEPRWRFEPLGVERFPVGESPYRVRGLAYVGVLDYIRNKTPGGFASIERALGDDPFRPYYDQLFVVLGNYDAAPLLRLFGLAAKIEGKPVGEFIERRARASARLDSAGTFRPLLSAKSLEQLTERLPLAFNRYFEPCRAVIASAAERGFGASLDAVPESMNGLYAFSTQGFVGACLEGAGAKGVRFEWARPTPSGVHAGVPSESLGFQVSWR
jgi:hypothetical protein